MERNNGLISKLSLLLDVGEEFGGVRVRRGGARCEGELCREFFLAESDGFRLANRMSALKYNPRHGIRVTLSFRVLGFDDANCPDLFCSSVQWLEIFSS